MNEIPDTLTLQEFLEYMARNRGLDLNINSCSGRINISLRQVYYEDTQLLGEKISREASECKRDIERTLDTLEKFVEKNVSDRSHLRSL